MTIYKWRVLDYRAVVTNYMVEICTGPGQTHTKRKPRKHRPWESLPCVSLNIPCARHLGAFSNLPFGHFPQPARPNCQSKIQLRPSHCPSSPPLLAPRGVLLLRCRTYVDGRAIGGRARPPLHLPRTIVPGMTTPSNPASASLALPARHLHPSDKSAPTHARRPPVAPPRPTTPPLYAGPPTTPSSSMAADENCPPRNPNLDRWAPLAPTPALPPPPSPVSTSPLLHPEFDSTSTSLKSRMGSRGGRSRATVAR
jgi:hypothetical protein